MGDSDVNKNQTVALSGFTSCAFYFFFFPAQFLGYLCSSRFEICSMSFTLWHAEGTDASARSLTPSACERKQKGKSKTKKKKKGGRKGLLSERNTRAQEGERVCRKKNVCGVCVFSQACPDGSGHPPLPCLPPCPVCTQTGCSGFSQMNKQHSWGPTQALPPTFLPLFSWVNPHHLLSLQHWWCVPAAPPPPPVYRLST